MNLYRILVIFFLFAPASGYAAKRKTVLEKDQVSVPVCADDAKKAEKDAIEDAIKAAAAAVPEVSSRWCGPIGSNVSNFCGWISSQKKFCHQINPKVLRLAVEQLKKNYKNGLKCFKLGEWSVFNLCGGGEVYGHTQIMMCPAESLQPNLHCTCFDPWFTGTGEPVKTCSSEGTGIVLNGVGKFTPDSYLTPLKLPENPDE